MQLRNFIDEATKEGKRGSDSGTFITIEANPASKRVEFGVNKWRKAITVKIKSPAKGGEANREILNLFSSIFGKAEIVRGEKSQLKVIFVKKPKSEVVLKIEELVLR